MQIQFNFKDGSWISQDWEEIESLLTTQEKGANVLGYLIKGKQNNSTLTFDGVNGQKVIRHYDDLRSVEFVF